MTSILEQEIREQPEVLRRLIETSADQAQAIMDAVRGKFNYILIAARGSSDNAARYTQYLFQIVNEVPVALATPSVFSLYHKAPKLEGALILGILSPGNRRISFPCLRKHAVKAARALPLPMTLPHH